MGSRLTGILFTAVIVLGAIWAYNRFAGAGKSVATLGLKKAA